MTFPSGSRVMCVGPEATVGRVVRVANLPVIGERVLVRWEDGRFGSGWVSPSYLVPLADLDGEVAS